MDRRSYYYRIFDFNIESNILLPELTHSTSVNIDFSFSLSSKPSSQVQEPTWLHHWMLPNGEISISFAKTGALFFLRFPHLADFIFSSIESRITCHPTSEIPKDTIRHLLLDQVLPRIVSYLGRPVLHASGSVIGDSGILFLGQTGWGKSTLCAYFHQKGFPLLSDDAILLEKIQDTVVGIPSYSGIRLLNDSLKALLLDRKRDNDIQKVAHYSSKKRVIFKKKITNRSAGIPIKALFVLKNQEEASPKDLLSLSPLTGYLAAIELARHAFQLDITDPAIMGNQLKTLAGLCASNGLSLFRLNFQRDHKLLPDVCKEIVSFITSLP
jgi:hypothetical protein